MTRRLMLAVILLGACRTDVTLATLDGSVAADEPIPSRLGNASRIPVDGSDWFLHGVNLPWRIYGYDFGSDVGAASAEAAPELDVAFTAAADGAVGVVRWYMFVEPTVPFVEDVGIPTGFAPEVYTDLEAAIALAERFDVKLVLVLFGAIESVLTRLADPQQRAGIAAAVEALARADTSNRVLAWGIVLDPGVLAPAEWPAITHALGAAVRRGGSAYLTADVFDLEQARAVCADGVDFAGFIEQGSLPRCASCATYDDVVRDIDPGCPVVVDIFYAGASDARANMQTNFDNGYAGAFGWSLLPARTTDLQAFQASAAAAFATDNPEAGPR